uniref:Uncharacterized protein n=1 Tax=Arundo donax TaxID=35708 RepID=A0A0A9HFM9_ARUDO
MGVVHSAHPIMSHMQANFIARPTILNCLWLREISVSLRTLGMQKWLLRNDQEQKKSPRTQVKDMNLRRNHRKAILQLKNHYKMMLQLKSNCKIALLSQNQLKALQQCRVQQKVKELLRVSQRVMLSTRIHQKEV